MKLMVIGYGRIGSEVVRKIDAKAHEVIVIDKERAILDRQERPSGVKFIIGNAIDEDLLREAGADTADVMTALTRDENTNLMIAQIARVLFNVPKVTAVIYDPQRSASFQEAGIETFPITVVGADILAARLTGKAEAAEVALDTWRPSMQPSARVPLRSHEAQDGSFYIIIVGGGLVGFYLARSLLKSGHEVTIVEHNPETTEMVSQQIDCPVVLGDGSTTVVLERVGASRANVLCAVTNHDQNNLIACQVAKYHFGVPKTIARAKNPKNERVMRILGVDTTVSSTAIITGVIENELPTIPTRTLANLASCGAGIVEYRLAPLSPGVGKSVRQLPIPPRCSLISILRRGEVLTSLDSTVLEAGDTVIALVEQTQEAAMRNIFLG